MATTTTIATTYAGEKLRGYIATALLSANSIASGAVSVKANVKYKEVIKTMALGSGLIADGTCDFDATSSVDLAERYLEPEEFQVNMQLCKQDFRSDWEAISMGYSAFDNLPPDFETYFVARIIAKVATENERILWQGQDAVAGEYAGFLELFAADTDVEKIVGTTIDATNVITELGKVVDGILPALYGSEDLAIYIPQNVYRAYVRSLGGFASNGQGGAGFQDRGNNQSFGDLVFDGVRLMVCNGLPDNTMIAAQSSNLYFGTGLFNDYNMLKVKDMEDVDLSQNVRFAMRWTATVNYGIGSEVLTYVPA
jgi:hypothetical protein